MPLSQHCERRPATPALDRKPTDGVPYRVRAGDSFFTLAERPEVKARRWTAVDLLRYNFGTVVPAEVNWYLYHKVGCRATTRDRDNYVFSAADAPGIVYLPPAPVGVVPVAPTRSNVWIGVGYKAGTQFLPVGIETAQVVLVSLDAPHRATTFTVSTSRLGFGVGVSGGPMLVVVTAMDDPRALGSLLSGGGSYSLSLAAGAKGFLQSAKGARLLNLVQRYVKLGPESVTRASQLAAKAAPLAELADKYNSTLVDAVKALGMELEADEPQVMTLDFPIGTFGLEVGLYHAVSQYHVESVWNVGE